MKLYIRRKDASKWSRQKYSALLLQCKGRRIKKGTPLFDYKGRFIMKKR